MSGKFDEKKATEWLVKAEENFKNDKIVLDLKEKLLNSNNNGENDELKRLETFLLSSLVIFKKETTRSNILNK